MASYLLIESRDPFEVPDVSSTLALASSLAKEQHEVTVFLVQNGVHAARPSEKSKPFSELAATGVKVLADDLSLRERGIQSGKLAKGLQASPIDSVVDALASGTKTIWR
jgi:sulfur relay (sulfurtransferase) complex TusBCD TusD component (DsrE family)